MARGRACDPMRTLLLAGLLLAGSALVLVPAASAHDEEQCHPADFWLQACAYVPHCETGLPVGVGCYPKPRPLDFDPWDALDVANPWMWLPVCGDAGGPLNCDWLP